jgi:hypothetical protein
MRTSLKIGGFAAALAAVLAISYGVGQAVGPAGATEASSDPSAGRPPSGGHDPAGESAHTDGHTDGHTDSDTDSDTDGQPSGHGGHGDVTPGGLAVFADGYTLLPASTILPSGRTAVTFQVIGPDGQPVARYEPTHDKDLHFIAVRRDTTGFQHVHPTRDPSGTWSTDLDLTPGAWRFLADFRPAGLGRTLTLGVDVFVGGPFDPAPLPAPTGTANVDDYTVTLGGALVAGTASELTLTVSRDGQPVTDLEPYLAAYGHLVVLRVGDLAYLHVHPAGEPGDGVTPAGPEITFVATAPSAGPYRLFLDFQHGGVVRTAEFTLDAGTDPGSAATPAPPGSTPSGSDEDGEHGHS